MRSLLFLFSLIFFNQAAFTNHPTLSIENNLEDQTRKSAEQGYDKNFIDLVEMIYGKGFLSQGGQKSVWHMIGDLDLNGLCVLDIGSGIGGPCLYLAEHYNAKFIGLEPQKWMIEKAKENLLEIQETLKGSVDFMLMQTTSNLKQFADDSFDLVVSKEALLHVPYEVKQAFFAEIYRVLKPSGKIIIMDWMREGAEYSENTKQMIEQDGFAYNLITLNAYLAILNKAGFTQVTMEDTTAEHANLSQQNIETIETLKPIIDEVYGSEMHRGSLQSWGWQRDAFKSRELLTGIFRATKS